MSNYGMRTLKNSKNVAVDMTWPIFGFPLAKRDALYKTFNITDRHNYGPPADLGVPMPELIDNWGLRSKQKYIKTRILRYEHKLGFRPVGYVGVKAKLNCAKKAEVKQYDVGPVSGGGNFSVAWREPAPYSNLQALVPAPDLSGKAIGRERFYTTCYEGQNSLYGPVVPSGVYGRFYDYLIGGVSSVDIEVDITDKYVDVYLGTIVYEDAVKTFFNDSVYGWDILQRRKAWLDLAGSVYTVSILLTDKKLEDFL